MKTRPVAYVLAVACVGWLAVRVFNGLSSNPQAAGVRDGSLADCPDRENCVSTQATRPEHRVAPLPLDVPAEQALARLEQVIRSMPRSQIVAGGSSYLHAQFESRLLGFIDDVEFYLDEKAGHIQVRSASRIGRSDLGVNRQRVEEIRRRYLAARDVSAS